MAIPVRVMVEEAWDEVTLQLSPGAPIREAKQQALGLTHCGGPPEDYLVKFRGAELFDESTSLSDAGIIANAALIVLSRRRRPVR